MNDAKKDRIYLDPKKNILPDYYDRDIVKVLTKNLKETYVFWGISSLSFEKILKAFECSKEEVYFKLLVNYTQTDKVKRHKEIYLPPFTNNWFLEFEKRIRNLKVEVIAYSQKGNTYSLLHSAEISIPSHRPSKVIHKEWLKNSWIEEYNLIEVNGEIHIQEGEKKSESQNFIETIAQVKSNKENVFEDWEERMLIWPDGSSGFMGSSGIFSSSSHLRKLHE